RGRGGGGGRGRRRGRGGRGARRERAELEVQPRALARRRALARGIGGVVRARAGDRQGVEARAALEGRRHVDRDRQSRDHAPEGRQRLGDGGEEGRGVGGIERPVAGGVEVRPLEAGAVGAVAGTALVRAFGQAGVGHRLERAAGGGAVGAGERQGGAGDGRRHRGE